MMFFVLERSRAEEQRSPVPPHPAASCPPRAAHTCTGVVRTGFPPEDIKNCAKLMF